MNRRKFVSQSLAASVAVGLDPFARADAPHVLRQPNVLYVFSDEHRACSLPGEPFNDALAPNITKFARESLSFRNAISNYPVCSPYRAMLLTGRWPFQSGIVDNAIQLRDDEVSIGKAFKESGYFTGYIGKWHLSSDDDIFIPAGPGRQSFEDWHVWSNTNVHFDKSFTFDPASGEKFQPKGYNCTLMTDEAVKFLHERKNAADTKPWMLMLSWNPPHPNYTDAPSEEMKLYDPASLRLRPNVELTASHSPVLTSEHRLRATQRGYYAHISAVDREFGYLLQTLEETGQAGNTIVVYTSDHGDMMGSQGYLGKRLPYEESCRVPFFIRYPGLTHAGSETDVLFASIDIYPSLCGLAGVPVPSHCVGQDLSSIIRGNKHGPAPQSVFLMHIQKLRATGGNDNPAPLFRGVRTERYTYAIAEDGRWCLYDNCEDPLQQHNHIADSSRAALMHELDGVVLDWLKKASDPYPYATLRERRSALSAF